MQQIDFNNVYVCVLAIIINTIFPNLYLPPTRLGTYRYVCFFVFRKLSFCFSKEGMNLEATWFKDLMNQDKTNNIKHLFTLRAKPHYLNTLLCKSLVTYVRLVSGSYKIYRPHTFMNKD